MDRDHDGHVEQEEMLNAMRQSSIVRDMLGFSASLEPGSAEHSRFELMFQEMDQNGDGAVTHQEFEDACMGRKPPPAEQVRAVLESSVYQAAPVPAPGTEAERRGAEAANTAPPPAASPPPSSSR